MLKTRKISSAEQFALHLTCIVLKSDDCKMQYIKAITLFLLHGKLFFAWLSRQVVTKSSSKITPYLETIILFKSDQIGVCDFGKIIRHIY